MIQEIDTPLLNGSFHTARSVTDIYKGLTSIQKDATKLRLLGFYSQDLLGTSATINAGTVAIGLSCFGNGIAHVNNADFNRVTAQDILNIVCVEISETSTTDRINVQYALYTWD
jgi:hypothetical protein